MGLIPQTENGTAILVEACFKDYFETKEPFLSKNQTQPRNC
jgi:hypothetical protein